MDDLSLAYLTAGGGGSLICEVILANYVTDSSSILDICRVDGMRMRLEQHSAALIEYNLKYHH